MLRLIVVGPMAMLLCGWLMRNDALNFHTDRKTLLEEQWTEFKQTYNKNYNSQEEEFVRKLIFEENADYIQAHNLRYDLGLERFSLGINQFADLTNEEFGNYILYCQRRDKDVDSDQYGSTFLIPENMGPTPSYIDWRKKGYVTDVKDQKMCGSCWAFSATGSLEGQHFKKTSKLVSLSEQNLVDCSIKQGNAACRGGTANNAFSYVKDNSGINSEEVYPYTGKNGTCHYKKDSVAATAKGFVQIPKGNETALEIAVATVGPVSVAVDARQKSFQLYKSGVYEERNCSYMRVNHALLVVGYDTEENTEFGKYWIVKNSWGTGWGNKGYIWMPRRWKNHCGIASSASYPLV